MQNTIILSIGNEIRKIFTNTKYSNNKNDKKESIYIIGNGWSSYYFVKNLDKTKYNPIIISPNKKVVNTTKLTSRVIDSNTIVEFENPYCTHIEDTVDDINIKSKQIITKTKNKIEYKYLVIAIGSESNDFGIPGVNENTYKLKTIEDADKLRNNLLLNKKSNIYIIGAGVTGIELSSKLSKLNYSIGIIEGMNNILPGYTNITTQKIKSYLHDNKINLYLNNYVKSITNKQFLTSTNTHFIYDIIIWTGGIRFNGYGKSKLFNTLNLIKPIKPRGIEVNLDFSIGTIQNPTKNPNNIYCIGDMVANMGPPTAQNAKNQGEWLAKYFNNRFDSEWLKLNPYKEKSKGKLVNLYDYIYIESEYYKNYLPKWVEYIIDIIIK